MQMHLKLQLHWLNQSHFSQSVQVSVRTQLSVCATTHCLWVSIGCVQSSAHIMLCTALSARHHISALQRGLTAHVPGPVVVDVWVIVWLHLNLDLGHRTGHPSAHGHSWRRRAGDLQVEGDAEEGQAPVTIHAHSQIHGGATGEGGGTQPWGIMTQAKNCNSSCQRWASEYELMSKMSGCSWCLWPQCLMVKTLLTGASNSEAKAGSVPGTRGIPLLWPFTSKSFWRMKITPDSVSKSILVAGGSGSPFLPYTKWTCKCMKCALFLVFLVWLCYQNWIYKTEYELYNQENVV